MAALDTVQDYLDRSRVLLQDTVVPYRYSDEELVGNLNEAMMLARMKRPDLFLSAITAAVPDYDAGLLATAVTMDQQYRLAFVLYMVGFAQLRDEEGTTDQRAIALTDKFTSQLMTVVG